MRSSYRDAGRLWFTHRVLCAAAAAPEPPGYDRPHRATKNHSAANERNIKHLQSDMDRGFPKLYTLGEFTSLGFHSSKTALNRVHSNILDKI